MRNKLIAKLTLATLAVVAVIMATFGAIMAHLLVSDVRQRADSEGREKTSQVLNTLEIVDALSSQNVRSALKVMVKLGQQLGDPEIKGSVQLAGRNLPDLQIAKSSQAGNFALVDRIKELTGNTATLFVKDNNDFVRISTNVLKPDGSRAIGTALDNKGRAYAALHRGDAFYGVVDILGSPYMTGYEPMKDKTGRTLGVWYVGSPLASLTELGKQLSNTKILNNGYVALMKADGAVIFKPDRVATQDIQARAANPGSKGWVVTSQPFQSWGYTLQAAYPEADVSSRGHRLEMQVAMGALLMMVLVAFAEYPLLNRLVLRPVQELTARMKNADINTSLDVQRNDEIGILAHEFDSFVKNIRETLLRVMQASDQFADASKKFSDTSHQISANSEEASAQANLVSAATDEVNRNLQTVATSTEEMRSTITEIAKNASEAAKVAGEALKTSVDTNASITKLGESSAAIGQVIKVITSIAQQTNLLALNATIEAARAGEAGKGFAVVANEVKELAKQTAKATEDISLRIAAIQTDTKGAVVAIGKIGEIISRVNDISSTIATAVEQQSATTSEMSRNVTEAARGSGEVAKNITGVAQAAQSTSVSATESQKAANSLARMSTDLRELVGQFKIDSNGH